MICIRRPSIARHSLPQYIQTEDPALPCGSPVFFISGKSARLMPLIKQGDTADKSKRQSNPTFLNYLFIILTLI